jgi:phosphomannomutase/phosphoglucomutase
MSMAPINPSIFREYDIRGVADRDLTDETARAIGRAFGTLLVRKGGKKVAVGRDARLSSTRLFTALTDGLRQTGLEAVEVGVCPTPLLYYALHRLPVDGGVMITGSHNPKEYNGFKLCLGTETLHGPAVQEIHAMIRSGDFVTRSAGGISKSEIIPPYIEELKQRFSAVPAGGLKVVLDSGNGTAGPVAPAVLRGMGCEVIELFSEPDGRFPNHHPDPTLPENLTHLIAEVRNRKADVGIGYDGDSDRIGAVDEKGEVLFGDRLTLLFARAVLEERPGATIISEVKATHLLYQDVEKRGGKGVMWKAGHSLIKAKMRELKAELGGEMSGHIFFADRYYGYDDAIYASCRLVEILAKARRPLSALLSDLPETFATPEIRVDCPDDRKFSVVERLKQRLSKPGSGLNIKELIDVDGVRLVFEDGWALIRASNTQPALVLRFEADTPERLNEIRRVTEGHVQSELSH